MSSIRLFNEAAGELSPDILTRNFLDIKGNPALHMSAESKDPLTQGDDHVWYSITLNGLSDDELGKFKDFASDLESDLEDYGGFDIMEYDDFSDVQMYGTLHDDEDFNNLTEVYEKAVELADDEPPY